MARGGVWGGRPPEASTEGRPEVGPSGWHAGGSGGVVPPRPARLTGELDGARLPDHSDPDLARVGQLVLDLLGHVSGDDLRLDVIDVGGLDHDPDLPPG